jgi:hypothetical protein
MTSTRIQPGTFVRHNSLGVGRVIGRDESGGVTVDFKTSETRQMSLSVARHLTALPDDGLEAMIWDGPDKIRPWVEDAPLNSLPQPWRILAARPKPAKSRESFKPMSLVRP